MLEKDGAGRDDDAIRAKLKEIMDGPKVANVQIRIGGDVRLAVLSIPSHIELTLIDKAGTALQTIKDFVAHHEELRTKTADQ